MDNGQYRWIFLRARLSKHEPLASACRVRFTMENFRCTDHRALALRLMELESLALA